MCDVRLTSKRTVTDDVKTSIVNHVCGLLTV